MKKRVALIKIRFTVTSKICRGSCMSQVFAPRKWATVKMNL